MYMNPECGDEFTPDRPEDFVGGARELAVDIKKMIERSKPYGLPIKLLISGDPGFGKSSLVLYALFLLNTTKWAVSSFSGVDMTVDAVREFALAMRLSHNEMFGDYRVLVVQEVDATPTVAQVRFLDAMDNLPKKTAVICTCNSAVRDLEGRFQTRFKALSPRKAKPAEVAELLRKWPLPEAMVNTISVNCDGNIRVALLEAEEWLQTKVAA